MVVDLTKSFELPTESDWDKLNATCFTGLRIDNSVFDSFKDGIMVYSRVMEWLMGYNNKVASIEIAYVLCKHYYDLGIPDERWYGAPESDSDAAVKYDPDFKEEHYMRRFWFNYFAESLYISIMSLWDMIMELINIMANYNYKSQFGLRKRVMDRLKDDYPDLHSLLDDFYSSDLFLKANKYRIGFVHGLAPSTVQKTVVYEENVPMEILDDEETLRQGVKVVKEITTGRKISHRIGEYTPVREVITTFEEFVALSATTVNRIIGFITGD